MGTQESSLTTSRKNSLSAGKLLRHAGKKRKTCCRFLNDRFLASDVKRIIFTDEKDFTLEIAKNHQNNRVYGQQKCDIYPSRLYYESSRFSRKVINSAGISWEGKTNIHFIDLCRAKVDGESCIQ